MEHKQPRCNPVVRKLQPLFQVDFTLNPSTKRRGARERLAENELLPDVERLLEQGVPVSPTIKFDGMCTLVREGWLCKRRDLKPHRKTKKLPQPPQGWFETQPMNQYGHRIGFIPIDLSDKGEKKVFGPLLRQDEQGQWTARVLVQTLFLQCREMWTPLRELEGLSCEFLGPKSQGNRYGLDDAALIVHGSFLLDGDVPWRDLDQFTEWMREDDRGGIEGIVLHFDNGDCFKLHRGHLGLPWGTGLALPLSIA